MWPNYYVASDFADEVDYLKQWLSERIAWMDEQYGYDPNAHQRGDVDGDGKVTIDDLTALIDILLNGDAADAASADCDQDGEVTISDVTALVDSLLSGTW